MPEVRHKQTIDASIKVVWDFVKDMNNWAPYMMGYMQHEVINEKESIWKLKSTIIGVTYSFQMRVLITEWKEFQSVGFDLKGLTHPVEGKGLVKLVQAEKPAQTDVTFDLSLHGKGLATPIVNIVVAPLLKPMAEQLLTKINAQLVKVPA